MNKKKVFTVSAVVVFTIIVIAAIIALILVLSGDSDEKAEGFERPVWGYKCEDHLCRKVNLSEETNGVGFEVCRIFCSGDIGTLWPIPNGKVIFEEELEPIDVKKIEIIIDEEFENLSFWQNSKSRFFNQIERKVPEDEKLQNGGKSVKLFVNWLNTNMTLTMNTVESYLLVLKKTSEQIIEVTITGSTYFGARHALETLAQLIIYDELVGKFKIPSSLEIFDQPKYPYRGFSLDTSRNFFSKIKIMETIDAMAMVKMNVFHWHITDSTSFPIEIKSQPNLSKFGAYSRKQIYTSADIKEIVNFAIARGIRIIPEFVIPAHVGEGWQFTNLTTCFNIQPWKDYCPESPCGQLDPSKSEVYDILQDIFEDLLQMFGNLEEFHMGGDDVSFKCWNTSAELKKWMLNNEMSLDDNGFLELWKYFHLNAIERFKKVSQRKIPIIMWQNRLVDEIFSPTDERKNYIIQLWKGINEPETKRILEKGYRVILSNVDALYFDCGFGSYYSDEDSSMCSYNNWHKVYENKLEEILGYYYGLAYGAEAQLWGQQVDDNTIDYKLWPRLSALAERLWSDPQKHWRTAEPRLFMNHRRLVENGIYADRLGPEWCLNNEAECPF